MCYFDFQNGDYFYLSVALRHSQFIHSAHPLPPPIATIPKVQYGHNAPLNHMPVPIHQELQIIITSKVGELMDFLNANDIITVPEYCEQFNRGDTYRWNDLGSAARVINRVLGVF